MCDTLEKYSKDGTFGQSWKNRFRDKWPTMSSLMHQSEITIQPYTHEYTDPHEIMAYQTCKIPEWDGTSQTSWSVARSIEHDILEEDIPSKMTSSSADVKQRRRHKTCRNVMCVFLILSVVLAVLAAIGLAVFLNLRGPGFAKHHGHHHGNHIHANITTEEEIYLSKIFCSLVKRLLRNTDFPTERGLQHCHAVLLLVENSEDLHIEMHVSPREGYTIKEKILRALKEGVLMDSRNRIKHKEIQTSISATDMKMQHSTLPVISVKDSLYTTSQPSIKEDTTDNMLDLQHQSTDLSVLQETSTKTYNDVTYSDNEVVTKQDISNTFDLQNQSKDGSVLQETSTKTDNDVTYSNNEVVTQQDISTTEEQTNFVESRYFTTTTDATTLPPIIMPKGTAPADDNGIFLYETTTTVADVMNPLAEMVTRTTTTTLSDLNSLVIQDTTMKSNSLESTVKPADRPQWEKTPTATKLFNPERIDITNTLVNTNSNPEKQLPRSNQNKSPKIVESLMAGGVMKLPFKTNSNFRFLFSSDSKVKTTKQFASKKPELVVRTKYRNKLSKSLNNETDQSYGENLETQINNFSRFEATNRFTEKPKTPNLFRTLRIPKSSTKSFMQRKAELPKKPKRTLDVTKFGDQRVTFNSS